MEQQNLLNSTLLVHLKGFTYLKHYRSQEFWLSIIILLVTVIFSVVAYIRWYSLTFFVGSLFFVHWLSLIATVFIAVFIPIYYVLKRKKPQNRKILLRIHVFGNLLAFLLISIHFAQNVGRLADFYPKLGNGVVLFLVLTITVATGFLERFQPREKWVRYTKFVHRYIVAIFYVVTLIHVLQGST